MYESWYSFGYSAGLEYDGGEGWSGIFGPNRSVRRGHGGMDPVCVAGWMRGFRHGLMDKVSS